MNCLAKLKQRTGESEAPVRTSVPERFRRLKWNEVVWPGDFSSDECLRLQLWEGPGGFRADDAFVRPIYRREETERFRPACYDLARFGAEIFRPSPRQADLMIVAGTVTKKWPRRWCASTTRCRSRNTSSPWARVPSPVGRSSRATTCSRAFDLYIPVDVHIPGCPPRPEALIHAFMTLQRQIDEQKLTGQNRPRQLVADAPSEFPVTEFGEHDLVPSKNAEVWQPPNSGRTE
jgi:Ni,Fe-hydrogenase III small subunit